MNATKQLLDYIATHHYLSEYCGKSRAAAYMFLTKKNNPDFHNGAVLVLSAIIKHVMASASETETVTLFYGAKG